MTSVNHATKLKPVSISDLMKQVLAFAHDGAKEQLIKKGEVIPVIFGFCPQENSEMKVYAYNVGQLMNSPENKEVLRMMMEEAIGQDDIVLVALITEAWLLKLEAKSMDKTDVLQLRPSEHPDKEEVVLVNIMTKTEQFMANAKIERDPIGLGEFEVVSLTGESEGTLVRDKEDTPKLH
jgi:hypothetical protein